MKFLFVVSCFLFVNTANAQIDDSSRREVKIAGLVNFRDLGGYVTVDGKHVKWAKLYRSADLSRLSAGGRDSLSNLKLAYIADFRGPMEVKVAPDVLPTGATLVSLPAGSEHTGDSAYMAKIFRAAMNDSGLIAFYSDITPFRERYRPLFDELLSVSPDSAVLFHCTAGKDRTGIGAALILSALNVPTDLIMQDYRASDFYRKSDNAAMMERMQKSYHLPAKAAANLVGTKDEYLLATFKSINDAYGSMDHFLETEMGLTKKKRNMLLNKFLE